MKLMSLILRILATSQGLKFHQLFLADTIRQLKAPLQQYVIQRTRVPFIKDCQRACAALRHRYKLFRPRAI